MSGTEEYGERTPDGAATASNIHSGGGIEEPVIFVKKVALLIAILALFYSYSESLGASAQTEAQVFNAQASNLWIWHQARSTRIAIASVAARILEVGVDDSANANTREAKKKLIDQLYQDANSTISPPSDQGGSERLTNASPQQLAEHARRFEQMRDQELERFHKYKLASAAFQLAMWCSFAAVISGVTALARIAGTIGFSGLMFLALALFAPAILQLSTPLHF